jgi:hypothetical protein
LHARLPLQPRLQELAAEALAQISTLTGSRSSALAGPLAPGTVETRAMVVTTVILISHRCGLSLN